MTVQDNAGDDFVLREQRAAADEAVRALLGVEPAEPGEPDDEAQFQAYMATHFPHASA
jgi:hypothetical protein